MAIFMLSPKQDVPQGADQAQVAGQASEVAEAATASADKDNSNIIPCKDIDEKTLVMDGPLSQVYTEALNQMFAKESLITDGTLNVVKSEVDKVTQAEPADEYMYVLTSGQLEGNGYNNAVADLTVAQEKFKKVSLCIEHNRVITDNVARMYEHAQRKKIKVLRDRTQALESIKETLNAWNRAALEQAANAGVEMTSVPPGNVPKCEELTKDEGDRPALEAFVQQHWADKVRVNRADYKNIMQGHALGAKTWWTPTEAKTALESMTKDNPMYQWVERQVNAGRAIRLESV